MFAVMFLIYSTFTFSMRLSEPTWTVIEASKAVHSYQVNDRLSSDYLAVREELELSLR